MERENNSRSPPFGYARTVHIFGAAITVPYSGGRRRRHPRQPRTSNPTEAALLIDFFADESDNISTNSTDRSPNDGGGRPSSNPVGLANVTGGFPFRFETGPPPPRDFLRIGDATPRRHRQPVVPPPLFDADHLRAQVANLLMQIMATLQEALGRQAEPGVVDSLAELVESMVQALEAAQMLLCPICRAQNNCRY